MDSYGEARVALRWPLVVLGLVAVSASFAGNSIVMKVALTECVDAVVLSFLRDVGGAALLLGYCKATGSLVYPKPEDGLHFVILGVLGVYIGQQFMVVGLQYVTPLNAMLLQPLQPVLTVLLGALIGTEPLDLGETVGRLKLLGILLAAAGAVYSAYMGSLVDHTHGGGSASTHACSHARSGVLTGNLLLLIQCVCGALYQLLQKRLLSSREAYPPVAVAAWMYVVGAISVALVLPVCKLEPEYWRIPPTGWLAVTYAVVMTSAFNYGVQAWANKHSSPAFVTAFFPLQVVFTAVFSAVFLRQQPTLTDLVGGATIITGLATVTVGRAIQERRNASEQARPHPPPCPYPAPFHPRHRGVGAMRTRRSVAAT